MHRPGANQRSDNLQTLLCILNVAWVVPVEFRIGVGTIVRDTQHLACTVTAGGGERAEYQDAVARLEAPAVAAVARIEGAPSRAGRKDLGVAAAASPDALDFGDHQVAGGGVVGWFAHHHRVLDRQR